MLEQQLAVGGTYRFTFKPEFVRHGVCPSGTECLHKGGGVFKVQQICTYVEILQANINLYANFFAPLGYSTDEYKAYYNGKPEDKYTPEYTTLPVPVEYYDDKTGEKVTGTSHRLVETGKSTRTRHHLEEISYGFNPIYKLIDVVDPDDIVYAPEKTILGVPEIGIREYQNMTIAITVGFWDDASKLDGLILNMRERLSAYGIRPSNLEAFSSDSKWMTPEEYDAVVEDRQPGKLVEITSDNVRQYAGRSVVVDGEFKTLIDNITDPSVVIGSNEIGASRLSVETTLIDNILFMRPLSVSGDDAFEHNKKYFVRVSVGDGGAHPRNSHVNYGDVFVELTEGEDYAAGDAMVRYVPYASYVGEDKDTLPTFVDNGPDYRPLLSPVVAQAALESGVTLYTCDNRDDSLPSNYTKFEGTAIDESDRTVYYFKYNDHIWSAYDGDKTAAGVFVKVTDGLEYFTLDYTNEAGLNYLGKRFTFVTRYGTKITQDINADSLVTLSGETEVSRIFVENASIKDKYKGRWYRYQHDTGATTSDGMRVIENRVCILGDAGSSTINPNNAKNSPGAIYGIQGTSWNRCFVTTDEMERSYIKKYHDELVENARLAAKVNALEELLIASNS